MRVIHFSDLLTAAELAKRLSVKPETILRWHRSGRIPGRRLSHKVLRFCLADVVSALGACPGISIQVTSMDDQSVQVASIRPQCLFAPIPAA